jgi:hypothetical protein
MRKFTLGFLAGVTVAAAVPAVAAQLVGDTGYLSGWTVTKDGEEICYMPYVWTATSEIECD